MEVPVVAAVAVIVVVVVVVFVVAVAVVVVVDFLVDVVIDLFFSLLLLSHFDPQVAILFPDHFVFVWARANLQVWVLAYARWS